MQTHYSISGGQVESNSAALPEEEKLQEQKNRAKKKKIFSSMHRYWMCVVRFWWQESCRMVSIRSYQKLPLCPIEPVPPKMDPPLTKAESLRDSGSTSAITYLKREKTGAQQ